MRRKYNLIIMKPSSFSETVDVVADRLDIRDGAFLFYLDNHLICAYPINLTIIKSITS